MKFLRSIFQILYGCHHKHLSRVFTIKKRTYRVCLECGKEFDIVEADVIHPTVLPLPVRR